MNTIGVIGGSGLYALPGLEIINKQVIDTPFGPTLAPFTIGKLGDTTVVFVPRHGEHHSLLPSEVPYRANVFALKTLGARWILSISAVGSLQEHLRPGDFVLPDQYVDRTHGRQGTFFGNGVAAHVAMANPTCPALRNALQPLITEQGIACHTPATYVCIEGPAFSTRAESNLYRQWGMDIIGMTAMPEARLAREAEMHYVTIGLVTDYDCWRSESADVDVSAILSILKQNTSNVQRMVSAAAPALEGLPTDGCGCESALRYAVLTTPQNRAPQTAAKLAPLLLNTLG